MKIHTPKNQHGAALAFTLMMLTLLTVAAVSMIRQNKVQIGIATNVAQQTVTFANVESALRRTLAELETKRYVDADGDNDINGVDDGKAKKHCNSGTSSPVHVVPNPKGVLICDSSVENCESLYPDALALANVSATVQAEHCVLDYIDQNKNATGKPPKFSGNELACLYSYTDNKTPNPAATSCTTPANWVRNTVENSIAKPPKDKLFGEIPCPDLANPSATPISGLPSSGNKRACDALTAAGGWSLNNSNPKACPIEVYTVHVSFLDSNGSQRTVESKFEIDCSNDLNNTDD